MSKTVLSDSDEKKIVEMRKAGVGYERIGRQFNITRYRVRGICEKNGIEHKDYRYGDMNVNWTGGARIVDKNGYVNIYLPKDHKFYNQLQTKRKMVMEHRIIMSEYLNRPLLPHENVHHKNGDREDNRIENLELWNTQQPAGKRPQDLIEYAKEILSLYAPEELRNVKVR